MNKQHSENYQIVISEAQLHQRIALLARQISQDFKDRELLCVGVLENGFPFVADLVRELTCNVRCQWVRPHTRVIYDRNIATTEILYTPEIDVEGRHVLLCEGILATGQTTDFLIRNFQARGAASISVCSLLDRQSDRRVNLHVAYYGFRVGPQWLAGFGLGAPALVRDLPFIFAPARAQA